MLLPAGAAGKELIPGAVLDEKTGVVTFGTNGTMALAHFGRGWNGSGQEGLKATENSPELKETNAITVRGVFPAGGTRTPLKTSVEFIPVSEHEFDYHAKVIPEEPVPSEVLATQWMFRPAGAVPEIIADGVPLELPPGSGGSVICDRPVRQAVISTADKTYVISGKFTLFVQGSRERERITIRLIPLNFMRGEVALWSIKFRVGIYEAGSKNIPLPLTKAVNSRSSRKLENESLEFITPGDFKCGELAVSVAKPDARGRNLLLLDGNDTTPLPENAAVSLENPGEKVRFLYLLHTLVKGSGTITAHYADGSEKTFSVKSGRDSGTMEFPADVPNGKAFPATAGKGALYLSRFMVGEMPEKLTFSAAENAAWCIAGGTFDNRLAELYAPQLFVTEAGKEWIPVEFDNRAIPGSPLDFSFLLDKPAGKYGRVIVNGEHFGFAAEPVRRIRFVGNNLCGGSCLPTHEEAEAFAVRMAQNGYNSIRLHHFDNLLARKDGSSSFDFDPEKLDRFGYLIAKLKEQGIYITIDLFCSRRDFKPGDNIPGYVSRNTQVYKAAILVEPTVMENFKNFVRKLMLWKNPYTGMTLAEDPVLLGANLLNENGLNQRWDATPEVKEIFTKLFEEFLQENPLPPNAERDGYFIEFLTQVQRKGYEEIMKFIRQEISKELLITDFNYPGHAVHAVNRALVDFVDSHDYWDHPQFPAGGWNPPIIGNNKSALENKAGLMCWIMPRRIIGKPHVVTEFNYTQPNPYRVEIGPMLGGYASLQDWDGVWRFCYSESYYTFQTKRAPWGFESAWDPLAQLSDALVALMFGRGAVAPGKSLTGIEITPEWIHTLKGNPKHTGYYTNTDFIRCGLIGRIGTVMAGDKTDFPVYDPVKKEWRNSVPAEAAAAKADRIVSDTGEITLEPARRQLSVVTPEIESLTLEGSVSGKILSVRDADVQQTIALAALDGKTLTESKNMLLFQLADLSATKRTFQDVQRKKLMSYGTLPALVRRANATVKLDLPGKFTVTRLKLDGSKWGAPLQPEADGTFKLENVYDSYGVMVYSVQKGE